MTGRFRIQGIQLNFYKLDKNLENSKNLIVRNGNEQEKVVHDTYPWQTEVKGKVKLSFFTTSKAYWGSGYI